MNSNFRILIAFAFLFGVVNLSAQTKDDIIKRNLHSRGGIDSLNNIKSIYIVGKIETEGVELPMAYIRKMPSKVRFQVEISGKPAVTVFTADSGWIADPTSPTYMPKKLTPSEIVQKKQLINYLMVFFDDLLITCPKNYISYKGIDKSQGKPAHKLEIRMPDGIFIEYFIDTKNYIDYTHLVTFPDINTTFNISLGNYALVEGVFIPMEIESKIKDTKITKIKIEQIKINGDVEDSLFDFPKF